MKLLILAIFLILAACAGLRDTKTSVPKRTVAQHSEANGCTNIVALGEGILALAKRLTAQPDGQDPR